MKYLVTLLMPMAFMALLTQQAQGQPERPEPFPKPAPTTPDEPFADAVSLARSAEYLDGATMAWHRARKCAACHTTYPYLMARPMLGDARAPARLEVRKFFADRVGEWDSGGKGAGIREGTEGVTEVVAIAATLAFHDAQSTGKLHPRTRQALDRMWQLQHEDGSWTGTAMHCRRRNFDAMQCTEASRMHRIFLFQRNL